MSGSIGAAGTTSGSTGADALPARGGPRPLRVLHVVTRLGMGGTEYVLSNVVNGLGGDRFEHMICATRGFDPTSARHTLPEDRLFGVGTRSHGFQFNMLRLAGVMRSSRADIVHSRNWGAIEAIPAARLAGVPVAIHSEHGYEVETLEGYPRRQRLFRRLVYPMADAVFTVTEELREFHARQAWTPRDRIRVIRNGVDLGRFAPRPDDRPRLRKELGLPERRVLVGTVGRMVPIKDYGTLLRAVEVVVGRGLDAGVLLVGAGPELERLREQAAASPVLAGRAMLPGASDRIPELLACMDAFVLPSLREGMSNTVLEAMASGLPVLATRVGGNPELVEEGRTGWLFAPGDVLDLADRLQTLASDEALRRSLGDRGRERAATAFGLDRMFREYRDLYLEAARRRGILAEP